MKKKPAFRFASVLVIFSLALVCILRRVSEQSVNSRAVTISLPPPPLYILLTFGYCINFCIYASLRTRATFSWPTLYNKIKINCA